RPQTVDQSQDQAFPAVAVMAIAGGVEHHPQGIAMLQPPVLALDFAQAQGSQLAVIHELSAGVVALIERVLIENSLAEAVDREDRGLVEVIERFLEDGSLFS